jgi:aromatic ring-opening dioxygenase LigB subunit
MSHRLQPGAPAGYDPKAKDFDRCFVEKISDGAYEDAVRPDEALRDLAAEDVVDTTEIALSAVGFDDTGAQFLSYEGPFGVGYLNAILYEAVASADEEAP